MRILPSEMMLLCGKCYIDQQSFGKWYVVRSIPFGLTRQPDGSFDGDFEGSNDPLAWIRDFDVLTTNDDTLGVINAGQAIGLDDVIETICEAIPDKTSVIRFSGHSKGGSMAILVAAKMFKKFGYTNLSVYAFEPARVAHFDNIILPEIYKSIPILITQNQWKGEQDIVPNEPPAYLHPAQITIISCPPVTLDPGMKMALHHWQMAYIGVLLWERKNMAQIAGNL